MNGFFYILYPFAKCRLQLLNSGATIECPNGDGYDYQSRQRRQQRGSFGSYLRPESAYCDAPNGANTQCTTANNSCLPSNQSSLNSVTGSKLYRAMIASDGSRRLSTNLGNFDEEDKEIMESGVSSLATSCPNVKCHLSSNSTSDEFHTCASQQQHETIVVDRTTDPIAVDERRSLDGNEEIVASSAEPLLDQVANVHHLQL